MFPVVISGPRVRLREFQSADLEASMVLLCDPEITRALSFAAKSREQQARRLAADTARARAKPRPDYYLAIANGENVLIGVVRIGFGRDRIGELGYALRREYRGKGYATEAASLMVDFGFTTLGLHRIQAACAADNHASQRVLARLRFVLEGRMRDHVFSNGAWCDSLLYSLLDHEWHQGLKYRLHR